MSGVLEVLLGIDLNVAARRIDVSEAFAVFDHVLEQQNLVRLLEDGGLAPRLAGELFSAAMEVLTQPRGGLLTIGGLLALYFSSSAVEALRTGLNRAYDAIDPRPWWLLRLQSILFMMIASFAIS